MISNSDHNLCEETIMILLLFILLFVIYLTVLLKKQYEVFKFYKVQVVSLFFSIYAGALSKYLRWLWSMTLFYFGNNEFKTVMKNKLASMDLCLAYLPLEDVSLYTLANDVMR